MIFWYSIFITEWWLIPIFPSIFEGTKRKITSIISVLLPLLGYCQSSLHNSLGAKALSSYRNQMHGPLLPLLTVWLCQSPPHTALPGQSDSLSPFRSQSASRLLLLTSYWSAARCSVCLLCLRESLILPVPVAILRSKGQCPVMGLRSIESQISLCDVKCSQNTHIPLQQWRIRSPEYYHFN